MAPCPCSGYTCRAVPISPSGVTRVGVTRGGTPIFSEKKLATFFSRHRLPVLRSIYFRLKTWRPFFCICSSLSHFYSFHSSVTPLEGVTPHLFWGKSSESVQWTCWGPVTHALTCAQLIQYSAVYRFGSLPDRCWANKVTYLCWSTLLYRQLMPYLQSQWNWSFLIIMLVYCHNACKYLTDTKNPAAV